MSGKWFVFSLLGIRRKTVEKMRFGAIFGGRVGRTEVRKLTTDFQGVARIRIGQENQTPTEEDAGRAEEQPTPSEE